MNDKEILRERYKSHWRETKHRATWNRKGIIGDSFVEKLLPYLGSEKHLLEIGTGSGRILKSLMKLYGGGYASYTGLDISKQNVDSLREQFGDSVHSFILGDAEEYVFKQKFDVLFSSTTFKHLYPSIDRLLRNVYGAMKPDSVLISDFLEGEGSFVERSVWTRRYTKDEITALLDRNGYYVSKLDTVRHKGAPGRGGWRLLVVSMLKKPRWASVG